MYSVNLLAGAYLYSSLAPSLRSQSTGESPPLPVDGSPVTSPSKTALAGISLNPEIEADLKDFQEAYQLEDSELENVVEMLLTEEM